jgi:hypothetical protein
VEFSFIFAWYDFWVGWFWDQHKRKLYILPFPCVGICIQFEPREFRTSEEERAWRGRFMNYGPIRKAIRHTWLMATNKYYRAARKVDLSFLDEDDT